MENLTDCLPSISLIKLRDIKLQLRSCGIGKGVKWVRRWEDSSEHDGEHLEPTLDDQQKEWVLCDKINENRLSAGHLSVENEIRHEYHPVEVQRLLEPTMDIGVTWQTNLPDQVSFEQ